MPLPTFREMLAIFLIAIPVWITFDRIAELTQMDTVVVVAAVALVVLMVTRLFPVMLKKLKFRQRKTLDIVIVGLVLTLTACESAFQIIGSSSIVTGRDFLVRGEQEQRDYGLYSYLLFSGPPADDRTKARYVAILKRYLLLTPVDEFDYQSLRQVNVTYLPVIHNHHLDITVTDSLAEEVLADYDYGRAQMLLAAFAGSHVEGPYIVSVKNPIDVRQQYFRDYLIQDLSTITPNMADAWMKLFLRKAAEPRDWGHTDGTVLMVELRQGISTIAAAVPIVGQELIDLRTHLADWIKWK